MTETFRLIKKYPNRRLYDTRASAYITLADVKALVLQSEPFKVVEARSDEDLTRAILLQIVLEEEAGEAPMLTSELLAQLIRFYGHSSQAMVGRYLENNVRAFTEIQDKLRAYVRDVHGREDDDQARELWAQFMSMQGPVLSSVMSAYLEQSKQLFDHMRQQIEDQTQKLFAAYPFAVDDWERVDGTRASGRGGSNE